MNRSYPRKTEITRAIEAAKACGIKVSGVEVSPNGSIKVLGAGSEAIPASDFEKWDKAGRL